MIKTMRSLLLFLACPQIAVAAETMAFDDLGIQAEFRWIAGYLDTIELGHDAIWATAGSRVRRIDVETNQVTEKFLEESSGTYRGIATGDQWVWIADTGKDLIFKIDPATAEITGIFKSDLLSSQGSFGAGFGSVWIITAENFEKTLTRLSADTGEVEAKIELPSSSLGVALSETMVWVTGTTNGELYGIDPHTNSLQTTTTVGQSPKFIVADNNAVWVSNLGDGTIQRVDPSTSKVVATIETGSPGNTGDLALGGGYVWFSLPRSLAYAQIDPATNEIIQTVSDRNSMGIVDYGAGSLWLWSGRGLFRVQMPE